MEKKKDGRDDEEEGRSLLLMLPIEIMVEAYFFPPLSHPSVMVVVSPVVSLSS